MATYAEFRTIGGLFCVARATTCVIVHQVTKDNFFKSPTGDTLRETIRGFELRLGFPKFAGAIDGFHIPIFAPTEHAVDYFIRKGDHSVVLLAVVDFKYR